MSDSKLVVCPNCDTTNRVPETKLSEHPVCGKCKQSLFNGHPLELTASNFSSHISNNEIPVLVDFWAPWCAPCRMMAPAFANAAQQLEPHVRTAKLNTEEAQEWAAKYNIRSIPTLVLFKHGREVARQSGAMDAHSLITWTQSKL